MFEKQRLNYLLALFMQVSSGLYLVRLGLSPVYFLLPILSMMIFLNVIKSRKFHFQNEGYFLLLTLFPFVVSQFLDSNEFSNQIIINYLLSIICYLAYTQVIFELNEVNLNNVVKKTTVFFMLLVTIETIYRFKNPIGLNDIYAQREDIAFYAYKLSSLMFSDSNGVAILLINILFVNEISFIKFNWANSMKYKMFVRCVLIILVVGTYSRAAILAMILGYSFMLLIFNNKYRYLSLIFITPVAIISLLSILSFVSSDGSGNHKLNELYAISDFIVMEKIDWFQYIFGFGFGFGEIYTNKYIHGFIAKTLIEGGILMFCCLISYFLLSIYKYRHLSILLVPIAILSFSLSVYVLVPFTVSFILLASAISKNELESL
ncbi:hypothetical protein FCV87_18205 [Vibrio breoganii]|uniref:hypothetical protein n=1 Tax=Vibrio breoganii TaxID=553239 RepID=UPI0010BD007C|nr:hypothetical protein [Vibrio breoganii]TKG24508.1 hypothetical protein FCV87_18205 [Vibrio breoganii]